MELYLNNANILQCKRMIYMRDNEKKIERCVKDYEFDLYINESEDEIRTMIIDGQRYEIRNHMLVCRKPGQHVCSWGYFNCFMLTVDFDGSVGLGPDEYRRHRTGPLQCYRDELLDALPSVFKPLHAQELLRLMTKMIEVFYPNPQNSEMQKLYLAEFFHMLAADALYQKRIQIPAQRSIITEVCNYIQNNYKSDITLKLLAEKTHMSPTYFSRLFRREVGSSPIEYLLKIRFDNARLLLLETDYSVKYISNLCGYEDESFFIASFKKRYGLTPQNYRKEKG